MTTLEISQHPELAALAAELRQGYRKIITELGKTIGEIVPLRSRFTGDMFALRKTMTCPVYPGISVVVMRREKRF